MEEAQTLPRSLPREVDEAVTRSRGGENRAMSDTYELRVQGHLDDHWSEWLGELAVQRQADGTTVLVGPVVDQAALHGVISRIRDLGRSGDRPMTSTKEETMHASASSNATRELEDVKVMEKEKTMHASRHATRELEDVKVHVKLKLAGL